MIRILHAVTLQVDDEEPTVTYTHVASILTDSLDVAFATSQQFGSRPWTERPRIRPVVAAACRSTSVGDVLELRGELHVIRASGFARVDSLEGAAAELRSSMLLATIVANPKRTERASGRAPFADAPAPGWIGQVLAARARR